MTTSTPVSAGGRIVRTLCLAVLALLALEAILIAVFRSQWRPGIDAVRRFNKAVLNPAMMRMAGSKNWYASAIQHVGRTSGRHYETPVVVQESDGRFYIPLPYGTGVDWCANVLAAGGCTVEHKGTRYETTAPAIVPFAEAAPAFPQKYRRAFNTYGVGSSLRLEVTSGEPARSG